MDINQNRRNKSPYKIKIGAMTFSKDADLPPNFIDWQFMNYCGPMVDWLDANHVDEVKYIQTIQDHDQNLSRTRVTWYAVFQTEEAMVHFIMCHEEIFKV